MATVYLARDIKHDRDVALKVLRSDLSAVIGTERFLSEVRITAKLDHPHILTLIDSGEADGILFYVLPYVRGESLRSKIEREKQLGIDEALSITKQVASALDYAHSHGVVHRDIKPENILLHEGEAVLADFGIALAVKEAGGNRLTETGLSLGTPQYMSPEQATGDRQLDKRSDIYSLGAVFYEMISGEPPVTGATAQVMIAKLLTERPIKLRVVRDTVSPEMELATERALAKVPADRFSSAGEFARALAVATPRRDAEDKSSKIKWTLAAAAVLIAVAATAWFVKGRAGSPAVSRVALRDRVQITNTGGVATPTISDDGKTIAYAVTLCSTNGCRYGVDLRDVAGGPTRRLVEGATAIYRIEISPDRRNVIILGSIDGVFGSFLVSMFGGKPRHVIAGYASFYAGGDSVVMARLSQPASSFWMLVAGIDGIIADSVRMNLRGDRVPFFIAIPGSSRIAYNSRSEGVLEFGVAERNGRILSSQKFSRGTDGGFSSTSDALWFYLQPPATSNTHIVRVPLDNVTGALGANIDTVYSGRSTGMSLTGDGSTLVFDEGSSDYSGWALPLDDVVNNRFTDDKRVFRATGVIRGAMSPDGKIIVIGRDRPSGGREFSVIPFGTTNEIAVPGIHTSAVPLDSATLKVTDVSGSGVTFSLLDYRTGRRRAVRKISDVDFRDATRLGNDTWAWIPSNGRSIRIQRDDEPRPRDVRLPSWYQDSYWVAGSADGRTIAFTGWQAPTEDSIGVGVLSVPDNKFTQVFSTFGEGASAWPLRDGSVLVVLNDTPESESIYRVTPEKKVERIGSTPRLIAPNVSLTVSSDLKRAFLVTLDDRRDVWMSKVVK